MCREVNCLNFAEECLPSLCHGVNKMNEWSYKAGMNYVYSNRRKIHRSFISTVALAVSSGLNSWLFRDQYRWISWKNWEYKMMVVCSKYKTRLVYKWAVFLTFVEWKWERLEPHISGLEIEGERVYLFISCFGRGHLLICLGWMDPGYKV